jgi:hypothetical protein
MRSGSEASAKVKHAWTHTSTPLYVFMAWSLVKHRDNFNFTFYLSTFFSYIHYTLSRGIQKIRGLFVKFVDSPYYSESELCGGAVTVSFSKYLP